MIIDKELIEYDCVYLFDNFIFLVTYDKKLFKIFIIKIYFHIFEKC